MFITSVSVHLIVGAESLALSLFFFFWSKDCQCSRRFWLLAQLGFLSDFVEQRAFLTTCDNLYCEAERKHLLF